MTAGWRALGVFWLAVVGVSGLGAAALQWAPGASEVKAVARPSEPVTVAQPVSAAAEVAVATVAPGRMQVSASGVTPWPAPPAPRADGRSEIRAPDESLQEPAPDFPGARLPKIAADGRMSMQVYARPFNPADTRPRVAMLVAGFGLSDALSRSAIDALPGAVSLGISPYAHDPELLLAAAAERGHEYLVTLPMESQGYPLNSSGPHALLTGADPHENAQNLEWVLSRMQGEVGVTGVSDGLRGERFESLTSAIGPVLREIAQRGLLYVSGRTGIAEAPGRVAVSAVVDDPAERASIDAKLGELEVRARDRGWALGVAGQLRPVTVDRIANWARGLDGRGIALVPVSALVLQNGSR